MQQVRSSPARAALMNSVRQGDLISALEEEEKSGPGGTPDLVNPRLTGWFSKGKCHRSKWMMTGGSPMTLGKLHMKYREKNHQIRG